MSKEFDIIKDKKYSCMSCTYHDSCKLLSYLNSQAKMNKTEVFDARFHCSFHEKQPAQLPKVTETWKR